MAKKKEPPTLYELLKKEYRSSVVLAKEIEDEKVPFISTGLVSLDYALLGIGGIPTRRIITIWGKHSSGKTTLTLQIVKSYQKKMKDGDTNFPIFIDAEESIDINHIKNNLGIDTSKLIIYPNPGIERKEYVSGSDKVAFALAAIRLGAPIVIVDSLAALQTKAMAEGAPEDRNVGQTGFIQTDLIRSASEIIRPFNSTLILVNHGTIPYGQSGMFKFEEQKGAKILEFLQSTEIHIQPGKQLKVKYRDTERKVGKNVKVTIRKNKVASPFMTYEYRLLNGVGFDFFHDLLFTGIELEVIDRVKQNEKKTAWIKNSSGKYLRYKDIISNKPITTGTKAGEQFKDYIRQLGRLKAKEMKTDIIDACKAIN